MFLASLCARSRAPTQCKPSPAWFCYHRPVEKGAVLYCRVSTAEQAKENQSLPVQETKCRDYCLSNDITVAHLFIERGESARTSERPEFQKMLAYCEKNRKTLS